MESCVYSRRLLTAALAAALSTRAGHEVFYVHGMTQRHVPDYQLSLNMGKYPEIIMVRDEDGQASDHGNENYGTAPSFDPLRRALLCLCAADCR